MMLAYNSLEESPLLHKVMVTAYRAGHACEHSPSALVQQFNANADPHRFGDWPASLSGSATILRVRRGIPRLRSVTSGARNRHPPGLMLFEESENINENHRFDLNIRCFDVTNNLLPYDETLANENDTGVW